MSVLPYKNTQPSLGERVYVADNATIIGDVRIGNDSSIWFGAVVRGDVDSIRIGRNTNVQDNCTIHVTGGRFPTTVGDNVTIGHGAIVHGCTVGDGVLIGMGARVLDGAVIGESSLVGAGAVVSEGMIVPPRMLVVGVPAKLKRPLTDDEISYLAQSAQHYVELKETYLG
jgi:carbonic anhydrase/acetyltransferase-like protein (isoleucine patch superfamily)